MKRVCKACKEEKDIEEFPIVIGCKGNRRPRCKTCVAEYQKQWNLKRNPIESRQRVIAKKLLEDGFKKCKSCEEIKPLSDYWANSRWPGGYHRYCKECNKEKFKVNIDQPRLLGRPYARLDYDRDYRNRPSVKERRTNSRRDRYAKSPYHVMQVTLRHGLRRRPTENPATIHDLMRKFEEQNGRCALTGIILTWAQGRVLPSSISLDRIDPNLGYSDDNLRLVCQAVNAFRGRMTDQEMLAMAKAIINHMDPEKMHWIESNDDDRAWIQ